MTVHRNVRFFRMITLSFIFFIILSGCQTVPKGQQLAGDIHPPSPAESAETDSAPAIPLITSSIQVTGQPSEFTLPSVDFIDDSTGWMIKQSQGKPLTIVSTHDRGQHWDETGLPGQYGVGLKFADAQNGWAAVEDQCEAVQGIMKCKQWQLLHSQDGGKTWNIQLQHSMDGQPQDLNDMAFPTASNGYVVHQTELLATSDGGQNWATQKFPVDGFIPQHLGFIDSSTGWVSGIVHNDGSSGGSDVLVFRTVDGGSSWEQQYRLEPAKPDESLSSNGISFTDNKHGWFLSSDSDTMSGGLYRTGDGGSSWTKINDIRSARPTPASVHFEDGQNGLIPLDMGAGPIEGGIMLTNDGGNSFKTIGADRGWSIHDSRFFTEKSGWAVGSAINLSDYLILTEDGGTTWTQVYPKTQPTSVRTFIDDKTGFGIGTLSDPNALLKTSDGGTSWSPVSRFDSSLMAASISFLDERTGWAMASDKGTQKISVLRTNDGGLTWETATGELSGLKMMPSKPFFKFFDLRNGMAAINETQGLTVLHTNDIGKTWQVSSGKSSSGDISGLLTFIFPKDGWSVFQAKESEPVQVFRTTDGENWYPTGRLDNGNKDEAKELPSAVAFTSRKRGLIVTERLLKDGTVEWHLWESVDSGQTWIDHPFPKGTTMNAAGMNMTFADSKHGWISTSGGTLRTDDGGTTWEWID